MSTSDNKYQSNYSSAPLLLEIAKARMTDNRAHQNDIKQDIANALAEIDKEYFRLSAASSREVCSAIRYEAALELRGITFAAKLIHALAAKHGASDCNPFELCKCSGCKNEYEFRYLEANGGYCDDCTP